jgi:hypothetical protein
LVLFPWSGSLLQDSPLVTAVPGKSMRLMQFFHLRRANTDIGTPGCFGILHHRVS